MPPEKDQATAIDNIHKLETISNTKSHAVLTPKLEKVEGTGKGEEGQGRGGEGG